MTQRPTWPKIIEAMDSVSPACGQAARTAKETGMSAQTFVDNSIAYLEMDQRVREMEVA